MIGTWSGEALVLNRKSDGVTHISNPVILVAGGMQPGLLSSIAADDRAENGFLARMCFLFPELSKKPHYIDRTVDVFAMDEWSNFIRDLVALQDKIIFTLSKDASGVHKTWYDANADKINDKNLSGYVRGVYGKLDIIVLRLAIVLKGMWYSLEKDTSDEISVDIMQSAIDLVEYFIATALKVHQLIFSKKPSGEIDKREVAKWLYKNGNLTKTAIADAVGTSRSNLNRILKE